MSQPLIDFESNTAREQQRREQQMARKLMLDKVRKQHEAAEQERVSALQRGENSWMLPSVEAALHSQSGTDKKKMKKNKKEKKKKKKRKKEKQHSSSSSSGSGSEKEWVEKTASGIAAASLRPAATGTSVAAPAVVTSRLSSSAADAAGTAGGDEEGAPGAEREGWMEMTSLFGTYTRNELREREGNSRVLVKQKEKNKQPDKPGSHARELNPYYRDGGSGLPQDRPQQEEEAPAASLGPSADWLKRALKRAQEQAEEDNIPLEQIAVKRWGSLDNFYQMLRAAEERDERSQQRPPRREMRRPEELGDRRGCGDEGRRGGIVSSSKRGDHQGWGNSRDMKGDREERRSKDDRDDAPHKHLKDYKYKDKKHRHSSPGKGRRKRRSVNSNNTNSRSNSDSSNSDNRSRSRSRDRKERRHRHKSPRRYSRSSSTERRPSSNRHQRDERRRRPGNSDRRRASISPPRPTPRLMKPPASDDEEDGPAPRGRDECAVWDQARRLPSKHAPSSGGWRKNKGLGASPHQSPKRKRGSGSSSSSSSGTSEAETARSRSRSPTHAATQKDNSRSPRFEDVKNTTPADDPSVGMDSAPAKAARLYTEHELNQLGAKIVKAELLGNQAQADKLKKKLDKARKESEQAIAAGVKRADEGGRKEEVVLLTTTNARGMTRPVAPLEPDAATSSGHKSRKKKPKVSSVGADGQRDKYFPDDNEMSLKQMFQSEKMGTTADSDALFVRAAARSQKASLDDDYTLDDSFVDRSAVREDHKGQESRDRMKAIMDHQRREKALASCSHCLDSPRQQKHLIVSLGNKSYLSLPSHQSLVEGHCLVVPREHLATSTLLDEDTWQEMKQYRQSLVRYFSSLDLDVLFLECCMKLNNMPHVVLHCVPLPRDMGDLAPIYYKKAIQESESEWNQNKKLVDLSGRDVRRAVPKGFPYFAVDFGSSPGYAHVIEDEILFPAYFGQSIVGGMLDIEPQLWRKPRPERFDEQRRKVLAFAKQYEPFDPASQS